MLYPLDNGNAQKSALLMLAFVSNSSSAVSLAVLILASVPNAIFKASSWAEHDDDDDDDDDDDILAEDSAGAILLCFKSSMRGSFPFNVLPHSNILPSSSFDALPSMLLMLAVASQSF